MRPIVDFQSLAAAGSGLAVSRAQTVRLPSPSEQLPQQHMLVFADLPRRRIAEEFPGKVAHNK